MKFRSTILLVNILFILLISCSVNKHYDTLAIFFDGVPNPNSNKKIETDSSRYGLQKKPTNKQVELTGNIKNGLSVHTDYLKKACAKCHNVADDYRLKQSQPDLCYQCHDSFTSKFNKLHGPVAAGFCNACHEPHKSQYKALLKMSVRQECQHCHETGDVTKNEAHKQISSGECLECHDPHGGTTTSFLKNTEQ